MMSIRQTPKRNVEIARSNSRDKSRKLSATLRQNARCRQIFVRSASVSRALESERNDAHAEQHTVERHEHESDDDPGADGDHVDARARLECFHRVPLIRRNKIDDCVSKESAEQDRAS